MTKRILALIIAPILLFAFVSLGYCEILTLELCKQKVEAAAKLIRTEGEAAFAELKDPKGPFRFGEGEGYVWVHNLQGVMLMHPIKSSLEGKNLLDMQDANGLRLFAAMNRLVRKKGRGWVCYAWPKPGHHESSPKVSYVELVRHGGKKYVVGSGMYDVTAADIAQKFPHDVISVER